MSSKIIMLEDTFVIPRHICKCIQETKEIKVRKLVDGKEVTTKELKDCNYSASCIHELSTGIITYTCGADNSSSYKSKDFVGMVEESKTLAKSKKFKMCNYKKVYQYKNAEVSADKVKSVTVPPKRNSYHELRCQIRYFLEYESWINFQEIEFLAKSIGFLGYEKFNVSDDDKIYMYCKYLDTNCMPHVNDDLPSLV
jgi:hypothetical protein